MLYNAYLSLLINKLILTSFEDEIGMLLMCNKLSGKDIAMQHNFENLRQSTPKLTPDHVQRVREQSFTLSCKPLLKMSKKSL